MDWIQKHEEVIDTICNVIDDYTVNDGDKLQIVDPSDEDLQRIVVGIEELGYDVDTMMDDLGINVGDYHLLYPGCEGFMDYFKDGNTIGGKLIQILINIIHKVLGLLKLNLKTKKGRVIGTILPADLIKRYNDTIQYWQDTYVVGNSSAFAKDAEKTQALGYKNFVLFDYTVVDNKINPNFHKHDRLGKYYDYLNPNSPAGKVIEEEVIEVFNTHNKLGKYAASNMYLILPEDDSDSEHIINILGTIKSTSIIADIMKRRDALEDYSAFDKLAKNYKVNIMDNSYSYEEAADEFESIRSKVLAGINDELDTIAKSDTIDAQELNNVLEMLIKLSDNLYDPCTRLVDFYRTPEGRQDVVGTLAEHLTNEKHKQLLTSPVTTKADEAVRKRVAETLILDSLTTKLKLPNNKSVKERKKVGKKLNKMAESIALLVEDITVLHDKADKIRPLANYAKGKTLKDNLVKWTKLVQRAMPIVDANTDNEANLTSLGIVISMTTNLLKNSLIVYALNSDADSEKIYEYDVAHFADAVKKHKRNVKILLGRN